MNVIQLCGGLGNQFFQYAFAKAQMVKGIQVSCTPPWSGLRGKHPRQYVLNKFYTDMPTMSLIKGNKRINEYTLQLKTGIPYNLELFRMKNCNFEGYWQYLPYFKNILPLLKKEFQVKEEFYTKSFLEIRNRILNSESVSIHVRRTDYINNKAYGAFPFSYYLDVIQDVQGDLFIFSDDISWCREVFKKDYFSRKLTFVHLIDYLDFELMRLCKHNISANSTFSYWASLLNPNPGKTVVVSGKWLAETEIDNSEMHFPKEWIRL